MTDLTFGENDELVQPQGLAVLLYISAKPTLLFSSVKLQGLHR